MKKVNLGLTSGTGTDAEKTARILQQVLRETALHLPEKRQSQCTHALEEAMSRAKTC